MKVLVDIEDDLLLKALREADVSRQDLAIDSTATDAVIEDALRAFVAIDGAREVLDERPDVADATTEASEQWLNVPEAAEPELDAEVPER